MCHKPRHAKLQRSSKKETYSESRLNGRGEGSKKNVRFSIENWPYVGNGERYNQGYY